MPKAKGQGEKNKQPAEVREPVVGIEDDVDALFQLPMPEFIDARNALASRLKKAGHREEAEQVKELAKPPISAWAVNQLYWKHPDAFNNLIAASERFGTAHASPLSGGAASMRDLLAARHAALSVLARLAAALLRDAGHNPTPDMLRRITTTLEALSTYSSSPGAPRPGRLIADIDPPGFDSLAGLIPIVARPEPQEAGPAIPFAPVAPASVPEIASPHVGEARIEFARAALQAAEQTLDELRTAARDAAAALEKATAHASKMEDDRRQAEEHFKEASVAAEEARRRLHDAAAEADKATRSLQDAERDVDDARRELQE